MVKNKAVKLLSHCRCTSSNNNNNDDNNDNNNRGEMKTLKMDIEKLVETEQNKQTNKQNAI